MVLFIDFDGTLHTYSCNPRQYFCDLPRLEDVLRDFDHVQVVNASDWRIQHMLFEIKEHFSGDIRDRVSVKAPT